MEGRRRGRCSAPIGTNADRHRTRTSNTRRIRQVSRTTVFVTTRAQASNSGAIRQVAVRSRVDGRSGRPPATWLDPHRHHDLAGRAVEVHDGASARDRRRGSRLEPAADAQLRRARTRARPARREPARPGRATARAAPRPASADVDRAPARPRARPARTTARTDTTRTLAANRSPPTCVVSQTWPGQQAGERLDGRPPADRAAGVVTSVRADEERGRGVHDAGAAVQRDVEQFARRARRSPTAATRGRSGSRRDPIGAPRDPGRGRAAGSPARARPAACARSRSSCATRWSKSDSVSPSGPHGPGCSTSRIRLAGKAVPSIGSPRRSARNAHRSGDSRGVGRGRPGSRPRRHAHTMTPSRSNRRARVELLLGVEAGQVAAPGTARRRAPSSARARRRPAASGSGRGSSA